MKWGKRKEKPGVGWLYYLEKYGRKEKKLLIPTNAKITFADGNLLVTVMGDIYAVISLENVVYVREVLIT